MTTDSRVMVSGMDFITYCNVNGLDYEKEAATIDGDGFYKMWIVDYLISNRDRHGLNWGFYCNSDSNQLEQCHPLYDHNNAFDLEWMQNPDVPYQFGEMSIRQAAKYAMTKVNLHFTDTIGREDFITDRQFQSFSKRVKELNIPTIVNG